MKLELLKVKIDKEKLLKVPAPERAFYLKAMNFLTDASVAQKCCWHSIPQKDDIEPLKNDAAVTQAMFFVRHLSGLIWEGYQLIRRGFLKSQLGQSYQIKELETIKKYFSNKENLIQKIRNKFAFHFDTTLVPDELEKLSDHQELVIYLVKDAMETRNNLYKAGDDIMQSAMKRMANKEFTLILDEIYKMATIFQIFFEEFVIIFHEKHLGFEPNEKIALDIPKLSDVNIPYFVPRN